MTRLLKVNLDLKLKEVATCTRRLTVRILTARLTNIVIAHNYIGDDGRLPQEIKALLECHESNPYAKFFGACGDVKTALDICFREEKNRIRSENFKHAKASDAYVKQKMQERRDRVAAEEKARSEAKTTSN